VGRGGKGARTKELKKRGAKAPKANATAQATKKRGAMKAKGLGVKAKKKMGKAATLGATQKPAIGRGESAAVKKKEKSKRRKLW